MEDNIKKILDDIYAIEPELKSREAELIKVIKTLIASRPEAKLNSAFQEQLKSELLQKFSTLTSKQNKFNLNFMNKLVYGFGGAVIVLILAIPLYFYQLPGSQISQLNIDSFQSGGNLDLSFGVTKLDKEAFGSLANSSAPASPEAILSSDSSMAGRGGGGMTSSSIAPMFEGPDAKMIAPDYQPIAYNYIYAGEDFSVDNEQMAVYKRQKGFAQNNNNLNNLDLGLIDLGSFANTKLQNFTLIQDQTDGYYITVDLNEGMISVSENWNRWYEINQPYESLKPEEVPADEEMIKIADEFLTDHGINMENYGAGEVDNTWRVYYAMSPDKANYFIAPNFTVVYPLVINGQTVYDQSGNKDGLRVNVNVNKKKAAGAYNIYSQKYLSSDYKVETNVDKILATAKKGGFNGYGYQDPNATIIDVELGTPTLAYIKSWTYKNNISEEILSPALIFPITKHSNDQYNPYSPLNIVVPLVQEIFEQNYGGGMPMPLMEKAVDLPAAQ